MNPMIRRLVVVYGSPNTPDEDAYFAEYVNALQNFGADDLDRGCTNLLQSRKLKSWPTIAECVEFAVKARDHRLALNPPPAKREPARPEPTPEERKRVEALMAKLAQDMAANSLPNVIEDRQPKFPNRDEFKATQEHSPNRELHVELTQRSRAMSGDR